MIATLKVDIFKILLQIFSLELQKHLVDTKKVTPQQDVQVRIQFIKKFRYLELHSKRNPSVENWWHR